jgi:hypothetical protein
MDIDDTIAEDHINLLIGLTCGNHSLFAWKAMKHNIYRLTCILKYSWPDWLAWPAWLAWLVWLIWLTDLIDSSLTCLISTSHFCGERT